MAPEKIAIVGSGLIGRSWAVLYSRGGYNVVLYDVQEQLMVEALDVINTQLHSLHDSELLLGLNPEECYSRISTCASLGEAVDSAVLVHECVPEVVELKRKVFLELDELVTDSTILCSSTSCIVPSKFTEGLVHAANCIVGHPVNPPHYCPAVEIIPAPWTAAQTKATTIAIMRRIGMKPVVAKKECDGFILNRLQYAVLQEGWRLVEDGVCDAEDIDNVMTGGLGIRWSFIGPFQTAHLNAPGGIRDYANRYSDGIVRVSKQFGEPRPFSGATLESVAGYLEGEMPVEKLGEAREWRDGVLKELAIFKQSIPEKP